MADPGAYDPTSAHLPQCRSRSGVWRQAHDWDRDDRCLFCDTRAQDIPRLKLEREWAAHVRRREHLLHDYGRFEELQSGGEGDGGDSGEHLRRALEAREDLREEPE